MNVEAARYLHAACLCTIEAARTKDEVERSHWRHRARKGLRLAEEELRLAGVEPAVGPPTLADIEREKDVLRPS